MKTTVWIGAAGLLCLGMASVSHAQSSVTLYGIIDTGLTYANHVSTATGSSSILKYGDGVGLGSRWGFKGSEDLGGGLKAIFQLENGFNTGTGQIGQSAMFGRLAYAGFSKTGIGELTFGRQYSLSTSVLGHGFSMGAQTIAGGFAYHINDLDQLTGSRLSNSVKFMSRSFSGLKFGAMYAFSNQAGAFGGANSTTTGTTTTAGSSRASSFAVEYDHGPFAAAAAYTDMSFPAQASPTSYSVAVANVNTNGLRDLRTFGMGARYTVGALTGWGLWTNTRFKPITGASSTLNALEVSGNYFLAPDLILGLGYTYEHLDGYATGKWHQANSVLDYYFSKRTDVYLAVSYQKALGENRINGVEVPVQAQIGSSTSFVGTSGNGSDSQVAVRVAIVHRF
ncbi:porin [Paraburkholderia sp.]|uniref:porin n=1 Tax=Paraburkholderia sp. TaxID=1926495 RepID=UPI0039E256C7